MALCYESQICIKNDSLLIMRCINFVLVKEEVVSTIPINIFYNAMSFLQVVSTMQTNARYSFCLKWLRTNAVVSTMQNDARYSPAFQNSYFPLTLYQPYRMTLVTAERVRCPCAICCINHAE